MDLLLVVVGQLWLVLLLLLFPGRRLEEVWLAFLCMEVILGSLLLLFIWTRVRIDGLVCFGTKTG